MSKHVILPSPHQHISNTVPCIMERHELEVFQVN